MRARMPQSPSLPTTPELGPWQQGGITNNNSGVFPPTQQPFGQEGDSSLYNNMSISVSMTTGSASTTCGNGQMSMGPGPMPMPTEQGGVMRQSMSQDGHSRYDQFAAMSEAEKVQQVQVFADVQCTVNVLGSNSYLNQGNQTAGAAAPVKEGSAEDTNNAQTQRNSLLQQLLME